ncbi:MAG: four-helix bundle copper-binding protein [Waterburya sp.]
MKFQQKLGAITKMLCSQCDRCAEACEKHDHEHCKRCAASCRRCAESCQQMAGVMA